MRFNGVRVILVLLICFIFIYIFRNTYSADTDAEYEYKMTEIVDVNGNVPAYEYYDDEYSRSIWGLRAYDNKIFMGLGDYGENTGPAKIIYYDTKDKMVKSSGTIADEAVEWFNIIDGKLYTTGTDPTNSSWGYGSYYVYDKNSNSWIQHEFNNGWVHVFDIEKFDGKLFMSGSIENENYSNSIIQVSNDGGVTFSDVEVYYQSTDISSLDGYLRIYDMVVYNNELYAQQYYLNGHNNKYNGYYKYDSENNRFNYISKFVTYSLVNTTVSDAGWKNYLLFKGIEFDGKLVDIAGDYLYTTTDMVKFTKNTKIGNVAISNMLVHNGSLYLLTHKYNSTKKNFTAGIYKTTDLTKFDKIYEFTAASLPYSFEYHNGSFYVGTIYSDEVKDAGNLYKIDKINLSDEIVFDSSLKVNNDKKYIILNGQIDGYHVSNLMGMIDSGSFNMKINDFNDKEKTLSSVLVTGDKLLFLNSNNNKIDEYSISILGDVNGDGLVNLVDLMQIRKVNAGFVNSGDDKLIIKTGVYAFSADLNFDDKIDLVDLLKVRKIISNWKD